MITKICIKCKVEKNITDFNARKDNKSGYKNLCKMCQGNQTHEYYMKHKEERTKYSNQWYNTNKEKRRVQQKQYLIDNEEKVKESRKKYNIKIRERRAAYDKIIRKKKAKYILQFQKEYRKKYPEKFKNSNKRLFVSIIYKPLILIRDEYRCQICQKTETLELHHILSIKANKNDEDLIFNPKNLIILCEQCHLYKAHDGCHKKINKQIQKQLIDLVEKKENEKITILPKYDNDVSIYEVMQCQLI